MLFVMDDGRGGMGALVDGGRPGGRHASCHVLGELEGWVDGLGWRQSGKVVHVERRGVGSVCKKAFICGMLLVLEIIIIEVNNGSLLL